MRTASWLALLAVLMLCGRAAAQTRVDSALSFFRAGGAYCFRVAPPGVALSEETEWTVMVLTGTRTRRNVFKIRELDPAETGLGGSGLKAMGANVTGVWRMDSERGEFFERFAIGIEAGELRARVVRIQPATLGQARSDRERAELYLKFSGRGSKVDFEKVPNLSADDLSKYADYLPD